MEFKVLKNPLDKGETWENGSNRIVEIKKSSDNRGLKPSVYFGIYKEVGIKKKNVIITEDIFFDTKDAIAIGKQLIKQAKEIDNEIMPPQKIKGKLVKGLTRKELFEFLNK